MTAEQARNLRKLATIKRGKLVCACGRTEEPILTEHGYSVTHELVSIGPKALCARGWNGDSNKASESGEYFTLDCSGCFAEYDLPEGMEVDWI